MLRSWFIYLRHGVKSHSISTFVLKLIGLAAQVLTGHMPGKTMLIWNHMMT